MIFQSNDPRMICQGLLRFRPIIGAENVFSSKVEGVAFGHLTERDFLRLRRYPANPGSATTAPSAAN
jgi:hypothetical protein